MEITSPYQLQNIMIDHVMKLICYFNNDDRAKFVNHVLHIVYLINDMVKQEFISEKDEIIDKNIATVLEAFDEFGGEGRFLKDRMRHLTKLLDTIALFLDSLESAKH